MSGLEAALDDAGKVLMKQRACEARCDASVDQLISLVLEARAKLAAGNAGAVAELQKQIQKLGLEKEMNSHTKELHAAVGKLNKVRRAATRACACARCCAPTRARAAPQGSGTMHALSRRPREAAAGAAACTRAPARSARSAVARCTLAPASLLTTSTNNPCTPFSTPQSLDKALKGSVDVCATAARSCSDTPNKNTLTHTVAGQGV